MLSGMALFLLCFLACYWLAYLSNEWREVTEWVVVVYSLAFWGSLIFKILEKTLNFNNLLIR